MIGALQRWFAPSPTPTDRRSGQGAADPKPARSGKPAAIDAMGTAPRVALAISTPACDLDALEQFLERADFYADGDAFYATDGDRLFALSISGQDWTQLNAWPPDRKLHEMPRAAFEDILGADRTLQAAGGGGPAARWHRLDTLDGDNLHGLALLAGHAVKGGEFCELHIPALHGPELFLLMGQPDWAAVLCGRALSLANVCEITQGDLRGYRFGFNTAGFGALIAHMQDGDQWQEVYAGPWHGLATRTIAQ